MSALPTTNPQQIPAGAVMLAGWPAERVARRRHHYARAQARAGIRCRAQRPDDIDTSAVENEQQSRVRASLLIGVRYPRFCSGPYRRIGSMPKQYSPEFRQRAVRMVVTALGDDPGSSEAAAIGKVAGKQQIAEETLRRWIRKAQIDAGQRPGTTTEEHAEIRRLKKEVSDLRRTNELLKAASALFASELDQTTTR